MTIPEDIRTVMRTSNRCRLGSHRRGSAEMLAAGGNAIDAAIATLFALTGVRFGLA